MSERESYDGDDRDEPRRRRRRPEAKPVVSVPVALGIGAVCLVGVAVAGVAFEASLKRQAPDGGPVIGGAGTVPKDDVAAVTAESLLAAYQEDAGKAASTYGRQKLRVTMTVTEGRQSGQTFEAVQRFGGLLGPYVTVSLSLEDAAAAGIGNTITVEGKVFSSTNRVVSLGKCRLVR